jgi:ATP phosphoribosyltransferase
MTERKALRLAIPNGNLQQATVELFTKAGYNMVVRERSYFPSVDDDEIECMLVRPQEQPRYVQDGIIDAGITGYDWIQETGSNVIEVAEMVYSKILRRPTRWVFVVPNASPVQTLKDLEGKRIATELTNLTRDYLEKQGVQALVEYSFGATEVKPGLLADAIVEATETGNSLRANGLRIIDTLIESTPRLVASPQAWDDPWKRQKIEDIALMLNAVMAAEGKVWLSMNVKKDDLDAVIEILPALDTPTINNLSDPAWSEVTTIVDEDVVRVIVPRLKKAGAHGIVESPLNKIID